MSKPSTMLILSLLAAGAMGGAGVDRLLLRDREGRRLTPPPDAGKTLSAMALATSEEAEDPASNLEKPARAGPKKSGSERRQKNLDQMVRNLLNIVGTRDGFQRIFEVVNTISAQDIPEVLGKLERNQKTQWVTTLLLGRWAETDPPAALAFAQGGGSGIKLGWMLSAIAGGWAKTDLAGALAWAKELPVGVVRNQVLQGLIAPMAQQNPQTAAELAMSMPSGMVQQAMIASVAEIWAATDLPGAIAWMQKLPDAAEFRASLQQLFKMVLR